MQIIWIYILGLTLVLHSKFTSAIICSMEPEFTTACKFGNMSLTTFKGFTINRDHCDNIVNISQFAAPPVVTLTWPNRSELFTVVMLDAGQLGSGPYYLQWLVTNVTADQLSRLSFPPNRILAQYESPSLPPTQRNPQYYQIVAFRQNSTLRNTMPQVHAAHRRTFNLRKWITGAQDNVKLCGPVAGIQVRSRFENTTRPVVPPSPGFVYPGQQIYPSAPIYPNGPPQPIYPSQTGSNNPPPGWIPNGPPAPGWVPAGNQGQTSWASSGVQVSNGQTNPKKKNHGTALRPEIFIIFILFITSLISYIRN